MNNAFGFRVYPLPAILKDYIMKFCKDCKYYKKATFFNTEKCTNENIIRIHISPVSGKKYINDDSPSWLRFYSTKCGINAEYFEPK